LSSFSDSHYTAALTAAIAASSLANSVVTSES
jgi:hypothetical protein